MGEERGKGRTSREERETRKGSQRESEGGEYGSTLLQIAGTWQSSGGWDTLFPHSQSHPACRSLSPAPCALLAARVCLTTLGGRWPWTPASWSRVGEYEGIGARSLCHAARQLGAPEGGSLSLAWLCVEEEGGDRTPGGEQRRRRGMTHATWGRHLPSF